MAITDAQVDEMVNRFLGWKLPKDFHPDAGISFKPSNGIPYEGDALGNSWWPIGTNLLTADQARQMIEHILGWTALDAELDMSPEAQQGRAWRLVADTLNEVAPGWWKIDKTGCESAAEYIRAVTKLAKSERCKTG